MDIGSVSLNFNNYSLDGLGGSIDARCVFDNYLQPIDFLYLGASYTFGGDVFKPLNSSISLMLSRGFLRLILDIDSRFFM